MATGNRQAGQGKINIAIAGLGNCAGALVEGIWHYRQHPGNTGGLIFPLLCGYAVGDIDVVAAFDISGAKVGLPVEKAIYSPPNNFVRNRDVRVDCPALVFRGPTLDGNPEHLAGMVTESPSMPVGVVSVLREQRAHLLVNLLPTGSIEASEFYAKAALDAGCGFVNCIPTPIAQREDFREQFAARRLPLLGDDIKSQVGTTILHRTLLAMLELRGASLTRSSQINVGGNSDFANFVHRSETKLVSKRKSLKRYVKDAPSHIGHHFDATRGALKTAYLEIDAAAFGGSPVRIECRLVNDDKPNCAGSVSDLVRLAKGAIDRDMADRLVDVCAFYFKSPPVDLPDGEAFQMIREKWS